jgi:N-formylmaleamate deformylase
VLQHGFSDNGLCWLTLAGDLQAQYDIVMPDARGHGRSARVPVSPAPDGSGVDMTAELAGLIRGLGLERPIVAGHSMGAMLASQLGARFPDLPRALILEDAPWRLPQPAGAPAAGRANPLGQWIASLAGLSLEQLIERNRADHPTWSDLVLHRWSEGKQQLDPNFLTSGSMGRMEWQQVVPAIACPTLLITADPDKGGIVTPEVADMATRMNARITVAHIPGTGHHVRFEDYAAYRAAVEAFLAQVEREG